MLFSSNHIRLLHVNKLFSANYSGKTNLAKRVKLKTQKVMVVLY